MSKIGRNDPCPCGSGLKYKKCCLAKDAKEERQRSAERAQENAERAGKLRQKMEELHERVPEIASAQDVLGQRWRQFARLARDPEGLWLRLRTLLSEPPFDPIRFRDDELERVFAELGAPPVEATEDESAEYMARVTRRLVDKDRRFGIASHLLCLLPEYVEDGRYEDAWIIDRCAEEIMEPDRKGHELMLGCLLLEAIARWEEEREQERLAMLASMGLGPADATPERIREIMDADDARFAAGERYINEHPGLKTQIAADNEHGVRAAFELIRSDAGRPLLLGRDELAPWVEPMLEAVRAATEGTGDIRARRKSKTRADAIVGGMYDVASQAAAVIFTKERLRRLLRDVEAMRAGLDPSDRATAAGLDGLAIFARAVADPGENHVLVVLCLWSAMQLPEFSRVE